MDPERRRRAEELLKVLAPDAATPRTGARLRSVVFGVWAAIIIGGALLLFLLPLWGWLG